MKVTFFRRSKLFRLVSLGSIYTILLFICLWLSYQLRFDFAPPAGEMASYWKVGVWVVALKLLLLWFFRQFEGILRYFSVPDMKRVLYSMGSASAVMLLVWTQGGMESTPPRGVILIDFILSCGAVGGVRMALRIFLESYFAPPVKGSRRAKRVGIFGAGDVGASLAMELMKRRGFGLVPVAFFDDDPDKWYSRVHDIPVVGAPESLRNNHLNLELDEVVIAMPSAPAKRIGELVSLLQRSKLKCATVPSMDQLATGQVKVSQLRSVEIQDLLGRDPVNLEVDDIRQILIDKVVLVTGAGGSIGSELCRQIASFNPKRLLMVEQSELNLFQIEQELIELGHGGISLPLIGDILDELRMEYIFSRFMPGVVFHAAAHKHVPLMEGQPSEAIKNNTFGTKAVADLALRHGVKRFVMISTDKAINPTNVMGASKRLGEIYVQSLFAAYPDKTKFMAVRFGNVLGSSGSVIPTFRKQIAAGGPVKVTHPDVTRYFMTIPEAVGLVLQSSSQGDGGEIFVLDMGEPIKIVDLARQMIELSGLIPDEDIDIEFVGLRPGEKLFEEISHKGENIKPTKHAKVLRFVSQPSPMETVAGQLSVLNDCIHNSKKDEIKVVIQRFVPEYQPFLT